MQAQLGAEAALMDRIWTTALYGGDTLPDARLDGADDTASGVVFRDMANAQVRRTLWLAAAL